MGTATRAGYPESTYRGRRLVASRANCEVGADEESVECEP